MANVQVFSDFDGTITKTDTLNKFLEDYAYPEWNDVEQLWIDGKIGSLECIEKQMKLFPKMEMEEIEAFIDSIEIDEAFSDFYEFLLENKIEFSIVSDGFDFFIERILEKNNIDISKMKIYSNKLTIKDGMFYTAFPYCSSACKRKSGVCKCNVVNSNRIVTNRVLYVGDGISDYCASDKVDVLFAKGSLLEYCKNTKNNNYFGFDSFIDVKNYIKGLL